MATESRTELTGHLRGVTVTTLACLAGVAAAFTSGALVGTAAADAASTRSVLFLGAFVAVQFPVLRLAGVDVADFGVKDYLYVAFMTFALWFITYTIMLSESVTL